MRVRNLLLQGRPVWIVMVLLIGFLSASCGKDSTTGPKDDDGCRAPDTPDNLIAAVACAYQTKDLDFYESLLHEGYRFVFVVDVADSLGLPADEPWWGKTKDLGSTANLFADGNAAFSITFAPVSDGWTPAEVDCDGIVCNGFFRRYIIDLKLEIEGAGAEPMTIIGDDTFLDVVVVPHPLYDGHFAVLVMEEVFRAPGAAPLTVPLTLSEVKAVYE